MGTDLEQATAVRMTRFLRPTVIALIGLLLVSAGHAATTALYFSSPTGEYIGGGITKTWTPADGNFSAKINFDKGVTVSFDGGQTNWSLDFAAPEKAPLEKAPLAVGTYLEATRYPFQSPTKPGLSVGGSGRGCNNSTGQFTVKELTLGPDNTVEIFAADFEQHCEQPERAPLRGTILFNAVTSTITTVTSTDVTPGTSAANVKYSLKPTLTTPDAAGNVSLTIALAVSGNHQGRQGQTFLVARKADDIYVHDGRGWNRYTGGTLPAYRTGSLGDINISVIRGVKADTLSGISVLVGYGASDVEMLRNNRYSVAHTF